LLFYKNRAISIPIQNLFLSSAYTVGFVTGSPLLSKNADGALSPFIFQTSSLTIILTVALNGEWWLL
jgi:hypothetical protein